MAADSRISDLVVANFLTGLGDGLMLPFITGILVFLFTSQIWLGFLFLNASALLIAIAYGFARYYGELGEIYHHHPNLLSEEELEKEQKMLAHIGLDSELRKTIKEGMEQERTKWMEEITENALGWDILSKRRALLGSIQTALGFLAGGLLSAFAFYIGTLTGEQISLEFILCGSIIILLLAGIVGGWKAYFTGRKVFNGTVFSLVNSFFFLLIPYLIVYFFTTFS